MPKTLLMRPSISITPNRHPKLFNTNLSVINDEDENCDEGTKRLKLPKIAQPVTSAPTLTPSRRRYTFIQLPTEFLNPNAKRSSLIKFRSPSITATSAAEDENNKVKKYSVSSIIENFDALQRKYSNPFVNRRKNMEKLHEFKRRCSVAISTDRLSADTINEDYGDLSKSMLMNENTSSDFIDETKLRIGSLLSYEGQFATLKCMEDVIKCRLKACILNLTSEFEDSNKDSYYKKMNLLKKLYAVNGPNTAHRDHKLPKINASESHLKSASLLSDSTFPTSSTSSFDSIRKTTISKHIDDGIDILDDINQIAKEIEIKKENLFRNLIDETLYTNIKKIISKLKNWLKQWSQSF